MSDHIQQTITELEQELESHYQAISDLERTLRGLRWRRQAAAEDAPINAIVERRASRSAKPKKGKKAFRVERTNERTNERTSKARATSEGSAEPP